MAFKYMRKDYLFWIYPLIILGLLIFTIYRSNKRESASPTNAIVKVDSLITISLQTKMVDSLKTIGWIQ